MIVKMMSVGFLESLSEAFIGRSDNIVVYVILRGVGRPEESTYVL